MPLLQSRGLWLMMLAGTFGVCMACSDRPEWQSATVTASAYTLAADETHRDSVGVGAWGDRLEPGMRAIAVSRDLIQKGLDHGTKVRIEGLHGAYVVRDKMNRRWKNKIDILVPSKSQAREWGKRKVEIRWRSAPDS